MEIKRYHASRLVSSAIGGIYSSPPLQRVPAFPFSVDQILRTSVYSTPPTSKCSRHFLRLIPPALLPPFSPKPSLYHELETTLGDDRDNFRVIRVRSSLSWGVGPVGRPGGVSRGMGLGTFSLFPPCSLPKRIQPRT